eukprot:TRINITY_DN24888_c0_g6_i1.p1 TRINITY_DN24888_c0_g6~~TRINITY_DN24888_c0_g6_i1.p1  ORF type:complete len:630 (-),score=156.12 TRINITY_DN24888_c0_g6_i1:162-1931(-)
MAAPAGAGDGDAEGDVGASDARLEPFEPTGAEDLAAWETPGDRTTAGKRKRSEVAAENEEDDDSLTECSEGEAGRLPGEEDPDGLLDAPQETPATKRWRRGEMLRKRGRCEEALRDFDAALALDAGCVPALASRARTARAMGEHELAMADYHAALRRSPRDVATLTGRGMTELELGWFTEAASAFKIALSLDPRCAAAKWGCVAAARKQRNAPLRRVLLSGFQKPLLNGAYTERRQESFVLRGYPTFWSADGKFFLYRCNGSRMWKGARAADVAAIRAGSSPGFIAAPQDANLLSPSLARGWHEWDGAAWKMRPEAGVASVGPVDAPLRTLLVSGLERRSRMNGQYIERRQPQFAVGGRETYWTSDGACFLYWCTREERWKGSMANQLEKIQGGASPCYIAAPEGAVDLVPRPVEGWHEWRDKAWKLCPKSVLWAKTGRDAQRRMVTLKGFRREAMNTVYVERRSPNLRVGGRETYHAADGGHFLFWCAKESRWKGTSYDQLGRVRAGSSVGFVGAPLRQDLFSPALLVGWHEWIGGAWVPRQRAGVAAMGIAPSQPAGVARGRAAAAEGDGTAVTSDIYLDLLSSTPS